MATSLYNLLIEIGKMNIPDGYVVSFIFNDSPNGSIKLKVEGPIGDKKETWATTWAISKKELETMKLDFVKDNIYAMIDHICENCEKNKEV